MSAEFSEICDINMKYLCKHIRNMLLALQKSTLGIHYSIEILIQLHIDSEGWKLLMYTPLFYSFINTFNKLTFLYIRT